MLWSFNGFFVCNADKIIRLDWWNRLILSTGWNCLHFLHWFLICRCFYYLRLLVIFFDSFDRHRFLCGRLNNLGFLFLFAAYSTSNLLKFLHKAGDSSMFLLSQPHISKIIQDPILQMLWYLVQIGDLFKFFIFFPNIQRFPIGNLQEQKESILATLLAGSLSQGN